MAAAQAISGAPPVAPAPHVDGAVTGPPKEDPARGPAVGNGAVIQPKDKKQPASDRVQNPHDPAATDAVKGQGEKNVNAGADITDEAGLKVTVVARVLDMKKGGLRWQAARRGRLGGHGVWIWSCMR